MKASSAVVFLALATYPVGAQNPQSAPPSRTPGASTEPGSQANAKGGQPPDSFTLSDIPVMRTLQPDSWLTFTGVTEFAITGDAMAVFHVADDCRGHQYLQEHNGEIDMRVVYRDGKNGYGMPEIELQASKDSPLDLERHALRQYMGKNLIDELMLTKKVVRGNLVETVKFVPVRFTERDGKFQATAWLPVFLLPKFASPR